MTDPMGSGEIAGVARVRGYANGGNDPDEREADILDSIGNVRVQFWTCPERHPREPQRVTVEWEGNVATCTDCGRTSRCPVCNSHDQTRVPERFRTHGPFCNDDWHRTGRPSVTASRGPSDV